jgi:hypothetical protein
MNLKADIDGWGGMSQGSDRDPIDTGLCECPNIIEGHSA